MINKIKENAETRMKKSVETLRHDFTKIRTGRASASFLDHVLVDYYGSLSPLSQVASVTNTDARTLRVTPWEKNMLAAVEKAILNSNLGLNPSSDGASIRVPMPALTEERRKEMTKIVRAEAEQGRISIRNVRRDANDELKSLVKDKSISEDDERRGADLIQKLTDKYIAEVDVAMAEKEKDLMEI